MRYPFLGNALLKHDSEELNKYTSAYALLGGVFYSVRLTIINRRKPDASLRYLVIVGGKRGTQHGRRSSIMYAVIDKRLRQNTEGWQDV
jgi:hypothetical protein